ncbi:F-box/kelch-repeat protein [Thalictrum thalictroides]|uniref:F-box/kelch-repeat protein n=1 Tax=Thalictrum thalictroides TaxID=46969 RepID=A0A7J6WPC4_THATH|nr:F-box/kelch-repeat protein [Thalictrum thalictroides]
MGTQLKTKQSISTDDELPNEEKPDWTALPSELLGKIGDNLPLLELLCFRSTCKDWLTASSTASAECEYTTNRDPWFLLYDNAHCRLYQPSSKKVYTIHIPELDGATCIASKQGWLLVCRGSSMFFFCPFSHAQIDLPEFPHSDLSNHIAVFSSPPTSPDCVVCVIDHVDSTTIELHMLQRGANEWDRYTENYHMNTITGAMFSDGVFYFLDSKNLVLTFTIVNKEWEIYQIVDSDPSDKKPIPTLPFASSRVKYNDSSDMKLKLGLEEGDSLLTCGTVQPGYKSNICIHNEELKTEDNEKACHYKGVWIHPRFFQLPLNHSWSL